MKKDKDEEIQYCWDKKDKLQKAIDINNIENLGSTYFSNVVWVDGKMGILPYHEICEEGEKYYIPYLDFTIVDHIYIKFYQNLAIKN